MNLPPVETALKKYFGEIAVLVLVAVTSFLVGSSLHHGQTETSAPANQSTPETTASSSINDIQQTLTATAPTTNSPATNQAPTALTGLVNINSASTSELDTLPGIGPAYAKAIIDYRTANGPFVRPEDIQKVKGIGPKTYEKLKSKITI